MARQASTPVSYAQTVRPDQATLMSSGRAGVVVPVAYIPLLPGDSASGRIGVDVLLREHPKPFLNGVYANLQAWVVPKEAHPRFAGPDEVRHALSGDVQTALGQDNRPALGFFVNAASGAISAAVANSLIYKTLGIHMPTTQAHNAELIDNLSIIWNFRAAAHSSRIERVKYLAEDVAEAVTLKRAFWPSAAFASVVPSYEQALVVGALDLDVAAGQIALTGDAPVKGVTQTTNNLGGSTAGFNATAAAVEILGGGVGVKFARNAGNPVGADLDLTATLNGLFAEMAGSTMSVTLQNIDKARTAQAMAKVRTAYAGNDTTGFSNDDTIVSLLMRGVQVDQSAFRRPWLLDQQRVGFGIEQRFASDSANLDDSVSIGRASAHLSLNVPTLPYGGMIVVTAEVLPERLYERMGDEFLYCTGRDHIPNALRDVQRVEPVDIVRKRRVDARHATAGGMYGYEPMNYAWRRDFTRLGGDYYQPTPGAAWTEKRSAIWYVDRVNPEFTEEHWLAPASFPHTVFSDTAGPAFDFVARHSVAIAGLTQMGDMLMEDNDEYEDTVEVLE